MVVKVDPIRKEVRSTFKMFICGAGEGLIDHVKSEVLYRVKEDRHILHV
jgi:hypothetical protein